MFGCSGKIEKIEKTYKERIQDLEEEKQRFTADHRRQSSAT